MNYCNFCKNSDDSYYTSDPPQIKCIVTGKYHFYHNNICDCGDYEPMFETGIATSCLICGEPVATSMSEDSKICDKCKEAVMKLREENKSC